MRTVLPKLSYEVVWTKAVVNYTLFCFPKQPPLILDINGYVLKGLENIGL